MWEWGPDIVDGRSPIARGKLPQLPSRHGTADEISRFNEHSFRV